jgi:hypothetical protein
MRTREPSAAAARPATEGGISIHNRLPPGHRCQATVAEAVRVALRGLPGPWDVSIEPIDRVWFRVAVVAPNGATWSASIRADEDWSPADLADTVRAACVRHRRLQAANPRRRAVRPARDGTSGERSGSDSPEGKPQ